MSDNPAVEIIADGRTVWINGLDGMCLGRFSRFGVDVHKDFLGQALSGHQCLDCKAGANTKDDWEYFKRSMLAHYRVVVGDEHMPRFLTAPPPNVSKPER
jgi:hypothetical protein